MPLVRRLTGALTNAFTEAMLEGFGEVLQGVASLVRFAALLCKLYFGSVEDS